MPAVSIILPCYNAALTLDDALESLALQTLVDFEVVAVDDGSSDTTLEILHRWGARDRRFKVLSKPHGGVILAANAGLSFCQADYIARMDADDWSHPDRLALQAAYLDEHPETAVVSSLIKVFSGSGVRQGYQLYVQWLNSLLTNEDIHREMFVEKSFGKPKCDGSIYMV